MSQLCFLPKKAKRSRYLLLFCCSRLILQEKQSRKYFGILFLLNLSLCSFAQEDSILHFSLAQAQSYASQNCYAIRNGQTDIATAKKKVWETTAIGLPQIAGNVTYQNLFNPIDVDFSGFFNNGGSSSSSKMGVIEMMPKSNTTFKLTASQLLFSGEYIVGLKAARTYLDMSEQSLRKSELDTREIVTNTYYQIVIMQRISEILRANAGLMDKTLNDYKEMLKVGLAEETSIDQLRINKTDLDNRLSQTMRGIEILEKLLKFQMGIDINQQIALSDSVETFIKQAMFPLVSTERFKVQEYIDSKILQTNEKASVLQIKRAESRYLPVLSAVYLHQVLARSPLFNTTPPNILGISLDVPIFSSGMRSTQVSQAKLQLEKAKTTRFQAEQGLELDFQQTRDNMITSCNKMMNLKDNEVLTQKVYDITLSKFNKGTASSFELTQAQSQYLQTEISYYNSVLEVLNLKTRLEKYLTAN